MPLANPFRRRAPSVFTLPPGVRVYAIGDVHGCLDLLRELIDRIAADRRRASVDRDIIVFLGDLIDRGPDSKGVIDHLLAIRESLPNPVFLAGNHEEMLLRILDSHAESIPAWLRFGGWEFCESYGLDPTIMLALPAARAVAQIKRAVPPEHIAFIRGFGDMIQIGDYVFVHAGIRPGVALEEQTVADLHWIREDFLASPMRLGFAVVHGHTIATTTEQVNSRIGIDTGAYLTGRLTALRLVGQDREIIQAIAPAG